MYIFPDLLEESLIKHFNSDDFAALSTVLDDVLANYIKQYMANPAADSNVVKLLEENIGDIIKRLTFHLDLEQRGIVELVKGLTPASLSTGIDLHEVVEKLSYLENNFDSIITYIPVRKKNDFFHFASAMHAALMRMEKDYKEHNRVFDSIYEKAMIGVNNLENHQFIFVAPHEKSRPNGLSPLVSRKRMWVMSLRGAEFQLECNAHSIPIHIRRNF